MKTFSIFTIALFYFLQPTVAQIVVEKYYFSESLELSSTEESAKYYAIVTNKIIATEAGNEKGKKKKTESNLPTTQLLHYEIFTSKGNLFYYSDESPLLKNSDSIRLYNINDRLSEILYYDDFAKLKLKKSYSSNGYVSSTTTYEQGRIDSIYNYCSTGELEKVSIMDGMEKKVVYYMRTDGTKRLVVQTEDSEMQSDTSASKIFTVVERVPEFPGGVDSLYYWLAHTVKYPRLARENEIQGKVYIGFIIDEAGKVYDPYIKKGVHPLLDFESLKAVSSMPEWLPGMQQGEAVNVSYTIPIQFKLNN